jgi:hypothetical protein
MDYIACDFMIPGKILRFLEQHANIAFAGTRDRDLVPYGHRVSGWRVDANQGTITAFVPAEFTPRLLESLRENGELAVTVEEFPSHETYQFKGRYVGDRALRPDDVEIVDRIRKRFVRSLRPIYADVPEDALNAFVSDASLAIEFEVLEIFLQTPGPGAGTRIVPPAER